MCWKAQWICCKTDYRLNEYVSILIVININIYKWQKMLLTFALCSFSLLFTAKSFLTQHNTLNSCHCDHTR